ncbi:MAG: hypothetical protein BZ135_01425 [Methanosphaera sp. rholeuAM6]|nr:MAG: hypothetical protein BZ135_01425 [Methanosphaera sp. rholeuAM6]
MSKKDIHLKNTNENGMTAEVELDALNKTKVNFGFSEDKVEYLGKVNMKDLLEEEENKEE